jgi:hypothetical protein
VRYKVKLWLLDVNDPPDNIDDFAKKSERDKPNIGMGFEGGDDAAKAGGKTTYKKEPVTPQMYDVSVAERLQKKFEAGIENLPDPRLIKALPTEWSSETAFVDVAQRVPSEVHVGVVRDATSVAVGSTRIPKDEPMANVVASFSARNLGTKVPAVKQVSRGDLLNFTIDSNRVLDPSTLSVIELRQVNIKSNLLVVDIQGVVN